MDYANQMNHMLCDRERELILHSLMNEINRRKEKCYESSHSQLIDLAKDIIDIDMIINKINKEVREFKRKV